MKAYIDLMILNQILQGIGYFFLLENIFLEKENLKKEPIHLPLWDPFGTLAD